MNTQRIIAVLILMVQFALYAVIHQMYVYVAAMTVFLLIGYTGKFMVKIENSRQIVYGGILGLVFVLKWQYFPVETPMINGFLEDLALPLTQYFFTLQVLTFFIRRYKRMPSIYPMFGVGSLVCLGDLRPTSFQLMYYQASIVLFISLTAIYFNAARNKRYPVSVHRKRLLAPSLVLIVALGLSSITSVLLHKYQRKIDTMYTNFAYANLPDMRGVKLSSSVSLGSVAAEKTDGGKAIAMFVYSENSPGYLRGRVFDDYSHSNWDTRLDGRAVFSQSILDMPGKNRFAIRGLADTQIENMSEKTAEIWPAPALKEIGFNQLYVSHMDLRANDIMSTEFGAVTGIEFKAGQPYTLHYNFEPQVPVPSINALGLTLQIGSDIDPEVAALARSLFANAKTPIEKIHKVVSYFLDNYSYDLGVEPPPAINPLTWFLTEQPPAHCEYFATGAAILLRLGGVPTRYVTGYVAVEKSTVGGYYVARSRDAHAWVEAWTGDQWMLVEATPATGVPDGGTQDTSSQYWSDLKHRLNKIKHALMAGLWADSLNEIILGLKALVMSIASNLYTYILISLILGLVFLKNWSTKNTRFKRGNPHVKLHRMLHELDNLVRSKGITRHASETLHQFARRIELSTENRSFLQQAATWYRQYADQRYQLNDDETISLENIPPIPKEV